MLVGNPTILDTMPRHLPSAEPTPGNADNAGDDGLAFPLVLPSEAELAALKRWKRQQWVEFALLALERGDGAG